MDQETPTLDAEAALEAFRQQAHKDHGPMYGWPADATLEHARLAYAADEEKYGPTPAGWNEVEAGNGSETDTLLRELLTWQEPRIYQQMASLGVEIANHATDLYVPVTPETFAIVAAYEFRDNVSRFTSNIDGKQWFDIPFAFEPAWPKNGEKWT